MNQISAGKWARRAVWGMLVVVAGLGCSPLNVAGFIFGRSDVVPAPYPLTFAKDGPKKDKEEVVVQLNGVGPWGVTYVNPSDDPRKQ